METTVSRKAFPKDSKRLRIQRFLKKHVCFLNIYVLQSTLLNVSEHTQPGNYAGCRVRGFDKKSTFQKHGQTWLTFKKTNNSIPLLLNLLSQIFGYEWEITETKHAYFFYSFLVELERRHEQMGDGRDTWKSIYPSRKHIC